MPHTEGLKERAARCLRRADDLFADAETLRHLAEELAEMARVAAVGGAAASAGEPERRRTPLSA